MTKFEIIEIRLCSLKIVIKLENSNRKTPEKSLKLWRARYVFVNNLWVKEKVSREILKIHRVKLYMLKTNLHHLWDANYAALRGEFVA